MWSPALPPLNLSPFALDLIRPELQRDRLSAPGLRLEPQQPVLGHAPRQLALAQRHDGRQVKQRPESGQVPDDRDRL